MDTEELQYRLYKLTEDEVLRHYAEIVALLDHRFVDVRFDAVQALGQLGSKARSPLRRRLERERNELVLAELATQLGDIGRKSDVRVLRNLAKEHASQLVRSWAVYAVCEIQEGASLRFLLARLEAENSRRVRASIACSLAWLGAPESLPLLKAALRSKDGWVRRRTANLLTYYCPNENQKEIASLLGEAALREPIAAIRDELKHAMSEISS